MLKQALTHRSYSKINYERLEFVGDGVLDYIIALNLYQKYPNLSEGELSKIRAALVNQNSLVEIALSLDLGAYLFLEYGEEKSGGRLRPSILADSLEAIFAAITLDSDIYHAKVVIDKLYQQKLVNADVLISEDSKSIVQEYLQKMKIEVPTYKVTKLSGPDHDPIFTVKCEIPQLSIFIEAQGKTKKEASQIVAGKILNIIKEKYVT